MVFLYKISFGHVIIFRKFENVSSIEHHTENEDYIIQLRRKYENFTFPVNFTWKDNERGHDIVTPVKDQEDCGSCSAFAASATIESCFAKTAGVKLDLSEQYLLDCAYGRLFSEGSPQGCHGAWHSEYLKYVVQHKSAKSCYC